MHLSSDCLLLPTVHTINKTQETVLFNPNATSCYQDRSRRAHLKLRKGNLPSTQGTYIDIKGMYHWLYSISACAQQAGDPFHSHHRFIHCPHA